jgi:hypothetical protein
MRFRENAERAAVPGTALDHIDQRVGNKPQQLCRLSAEIR